MKSKYKVKLLGFVVLLCMLVVVACGSPGTETPATDVPEEDAGNQYQVDGDEELDDTVVQDDTNQETGDIPDESNDDGNVEGGPVSIPIYQSNEQGDSLMTTEETIESLTPENVLSALINRGDLPSGIQVLSFSESDVDGIILIQLNLSTEFNDFIAAQGSAGEFVAIGSVVNTFLSAFNAGSILITVGGEVLTTPHIGELSEPMGRFDIF
jgi:hypothetical protein